MKKGIILILTLILTAGASAPAYAAETAQSPGQKQTVEVTLDSIEDIMSTYNLDLQTYENSLKTAKYNYNKAEDGTEDYYKNQYDIAKVQHDENVANAILSAKESYLAYCADYDQYTAAQTTANNAQNAYNTALASLSAGFVSQKDCDSLKDTYLTAQNTLSQLDQQIDRDRTSLRTLLNLPTTVNMSVKQLSVFDLDFSDIPKINYDADQIVMLGLDSKIKEANLSYKYQDDHGYDSHELDNAEIAVEQARESEKAAFKKLYDSLNSAYTVYRQDLDKVQRAQQTLDTEKKAFAAGYSSRQSVDGKTNDLNALQSTLAADRNTLYASHLNYTNMKKGFSTGS
jgi:outer membrane protein TolC